MPDTPLARALVERIRKEGPLTVEAYMEACNAYYYATRDPLGSSGDFVTAPEIHQMFGELVGAALADVWIRAGKPADAVYVELGPGRGTLANDALRVLRRAGFEGEVHLVETSPALREAQAKLLPEAIFHDDLATLPEAPLLLAANEFFDALPVRQFIGERERHVILAAGGFAFDRDGPIVERSPARVEVADQLAGHIARNGGAAIIIDYGYTEEEVGDTLQAVRGHRFSYVLDHPGEQDLTAHVDFASLADAARQAGATPSRAVSQGTWLETLGIAARAMALAAKNPQDTESISAARRRLCDEGEMGRLFKVLAIRVPSWPDVAGLGS
ncbi:SAM-dependent methyltransferase [Sphingomonas sp. NSE70-1]|uniref:SAM-dependent methyltransferase n=1 Tax=Sphingomonas caseinilyticus TaxID=2908205 RepID=A0ABT0RWA8_9SPHN|nr:SAM-dependent methyltransferase [Sphingomonas caseinilyticus]MCL6699113.1 SAM-dependent methyltransferase [Sphingomonas caseinilyticus]